VASGSSGVGDKAEKRIIAKHPVLAETMRVGDNMAVHASRSRAIAALALMAVLSVTGALKRVDAVSSPTDRDVKAAFVYNFAKFVEFPSGTFSSADSPIIIGIFGDDQFSSTIEKLIKGKSVDGRRLEVRRFEKPRDCDACQMLFVGSSDSERVSSALDRVRSTTLLTIGDSDGFTRRGGVIGFVVDREKIGFEINVGAAKRHGLKISSKLLNLAKAVIR
jgi:hypothetical protein